MSTRLEMVETDALQLPFGERAALAQTLLASLVVDEDIEESWAIEVERRNAEIEIGRSSTSSLPDVMQRIKAKDSLFISATPGLK
jgi:putative addiction module component (TIGR02574 family)